MTGNRLSRIGFTFVLIVACVVAAGERMRTLKGHPEWVTGVAFSPEGATLASGSWDGTVILWNVAP